MHHSPVRAFSLGFALAVLGSPFTAQSGEFRIHDHAVVFRECEVSDLQERVKDRGYDVVIYTVRSVTDLRELRERAEMRAISLRTFVVAIDARRHAVVASFGSDLPLEEASLPGIRKAGRAYLAAGFYADAVEAMLIELDASMPAELPLPPRAPEGPFWTPPPSPLLSPPPPRSPELRAPPPGILLAGISTASETSTVAVEPSVARTVFWAGWIVCLASIAYSISAWRRTHRKTQKKGV